MNLGSIRSGDLGLGGVVSLGTITKVCLGTAIGSHGPSPSAAESHCQYHNLFSFLFSTIGPSENDILLLIWGSFFVFAVFCCWQSSCNYYTSYSYCACMNGGNLAALSCVPYTPNEDSIFGKSGGAQFPPAAVLGQECFARCLDWCPKP